MVDAVNAPSGLIAPSAEHEGEILTRADLSYAERAYRVIRDRLVLLDVAPGSPVHDASLAADLGLGRTPVREALKRLETERLIVSYPRRGTFATDVNITDLAQISEVRLALEPVAAASAARRASPDDHRQLHDAQERLTALAARGDVSGAELLRLDMRIHRLLYAATANPYLTDTLVTYHSLATRIWGLFVDRPRQHGQPRRRPRAAAGCHRGRQGRRSEPMGTRARGRFRAGDPRGHVTRRPGNRARLASRRSTRSTNGGPVATRRTLTRSAGGAPDFDDGMAAITERLELPQGFDADVTAEAERARGGRAEPGSLAGRPHRPAPGHDRPAGCDRP